MEIYFFIFFSSCYNKINKLKLCSFIICKEFSNFFCQLVTIDLTLKYIKSAIEIKHFLENIMPCFKK